MPQTLRSGISDVVNDLNKARGAVSDPFVQVKIQKVLRQLFIVWEFTIIEQMDRTSDDYKDAIEKIKAAKVDAKAAVKDIERVEEAIKSAIKAAKAIDKIIDIALKII